ncbi:MAG: SUF system NifU family Fe-S cluster assembly protein [Gemmatimonadales bacterium]
MATMDELYQSVIIEHDRSPRNFRRLEAPTHQADGRNPLCGDEVHLELRVDEEGRIAEVGFQGRGCAVSKASASMMTTALGGRTLPEALELADRFQALLTGKREADASLGKLKVFQGLAAYPMRVKCATMPWHALREALRSEL